MSTIEDLGAKKFQRPDLKGLLSSETKKKEQKGDLLKQIPKVTTPNMKTVVNKKQASIEGYKNVYPLSDKEIIVKFKSDRFVLFQSVIVASLPLQDGSDYFIHPTANAFVNSNGDCWDNKTLLATYKTFIGSPACLDHPDDPDQDNVGVILDAVPRRRVLNKEYGTYNYYIDILVAIDKLTYPELAQRILKRQIKYMSMGCVVSKGYCSRCGYEVDYINSKNPKTCDHLKYQKGKTFLDNTGEKRIVGELLGRNGQGVRFIEASVLSEPPAFQGAYASQIFLVEADKDITMKLPIECLNSLACKKYIFLK